MKIGAGVWEGPYSYGSRFEEGAGTNPEELIGAAHAGCFSMALAGVLARAGHTPRGIHTTARVYLDKVGEGFRITRIDLHTEVKVTGIDGAAFQEQAEEAKKNCPVSQALGGVEIRLEAKMV
jgi:osmotically inducible protein OsmC